jgi:SAM-dependent methyltransferase
MVVFDELALVYDQAINWTNRLNRELPFLKSLIRSQKPARVLDLACGSGRHANALATEGHQVTGLDRSQAMIDAATRIANQEETQVSYFVGDMQEAPILVEGPFDLIMCLGNSLALLPDYNAVKHTLQGVRSLLRESGTFIFQVLNFQEIRHTNFRFFPLKTGTLSSGDDVVFVRFFEPFTDATTATLVFAGFIKHKTTWTVKVSTHAVLQFNQAVLENSLKNTGFQELQYFANYDRSSFSPLESRNIIVVSKT